MSLRMSDGARKRSLNKSPQQLRSAAGLSDGGVSAMQLYAWSDTQSTQLVEDCRYSDHRLPSYGRRGSESGEARTKVHPEL